MSTREGARPAEATAAPDADRIEALDRRFREHLDTQVRQPLAAAIEEYARHLDQGVARVRSAVRSGVEADASGSDPADRHQHARRFLAACDDDLLEQAEGARDDLLRRLAAVADSDPDLPESVTTVAADATAAIADPMVRPRLARRLLVRLRKPEQRTVPVGDLARLYMAELDRLLEPATTRAGRLGSVARVAIRRQLHDPQPGDAETGIEAAAAAAIMPVETAVAEVADAFGRALRAPAVRIDPDTAAELREETARNRDRLIEGWRSFEEALEANTAAEAVLARGVAAMEVAAQRAATELDDALDRSGRQPLDRLARSLRRLAERASAALADDARASAIEPFRDEVTELFDSGMPGSTDRLRTELEATVSRFIDTLAEIPDSVPDGLRISEEAVVTVPERPEEMELRDAPLDELLATACRGTLPRWIERGLRLGVDELNVLRQELVRVRNAVEFHIRAPLRGEFDRADANELVVGSLERAAAQLEEFRDTGLDAIERLVPELERRAAEEAEVMRSAVAEREFLRIRSEIAEEQAARHLTTGRAWATRMVVAALRIARQGWTGGRGLFERTQGWAQRQLGVAALEREEMLESMEESLLDAEDQVVIPGLYRQLFDVEGDVPWDELLVARDEEMDTLGRAVARWRRGRSAAVAVIGEKGSGKTTLLRMSRSVFGDANLQTVRLDGTITEPAVLMARLAEGLNLDGVREDDLAAGLRASGPRVIVLEDAHHLFIRALGGFRAMEAFLELVASTRGDVLWVITMTYHAWQYLDRAVGMAPHFTHVVNTTALSPEKLERAIMARHEVSGFGLKFELESSRAATSSWWQRYQARKAQGELSRREFERRTYFRELNQIAEGNIFLALFYWLRSVDRVEDHDLVLHSPEMVDVGFLEQLPLPSLHTIAGMILHGGLSQAEHERIFHLTPPESRLQLASLADAHLIFPTDDGEYRVNKVLYRPLTRLLKARNIF